MGGFFFRSKRGRKDAGLHHLSVLLTEQSGLLLLVVQQERVLFLSPALRQYLHIPLTLCCQGMATHELLSEKTIAALQALTRAEAPTVVSAELLRWSEKEHVTLSLCAQVHDEIPDSVLLYGLLPMVKEPSKLSLGSDQEEALASLSHEIRTSVTSLLALLALLDDTSLSDDQAQYVKAMLGEAQAMRTLLSDALDEFRMNAQQIILQKELFSLREQLEDVVARYQLQYPTLTVALYYAPQVPSIVYGDAHRVCQMVTNLLSNAFKFTTKGSVTVHVSLGGRDPEHEFLTIMVQDTGKGITEKDQQGIFRPFVQVTSREQPAQGFGLGLHITHKLAVLHGGDISIQSELGVGTSIALHLPLLCKPSKACSENQQEPSATLPSGEEKYTEAIHPTGNQEILLVDDNPVNLLVEKKFFLRWGYSVTTASSGVEALALLQKKTFGIIFMDLRMPEMDGFETVKRLRTLGGDAAKVPVIALTASTEIGIKTKIFDSGMQGYIFKPFHTDDLREMLHRYIGLPPEEEV